MKIQNKLRTSRRKIKMREKSERTLKTSRNHMHKSQILNTRLVKVPRDTSSHSSFNELSIGQSRMTTRENFKAK